MDIDFDQNSPLCLQHKTTTGSIDGTVVGYGFLAYSVGGVVGRFRVRESRVLLLNEYKITLLDLGAGAVVTETIVRNQNKNIVVTLRRSSGAILATLSEIAAALDAFHDAAGQRCPIAAGVTTDGVITAGLASTALAGGYDYIVNRGLIRVDLGAANGGGIFFNNKQPIIILQVEVSYPGTPKLELVNADSGLILSDPIDLTSIAPSGVFIGGLNRAIHVAPCQALKFSGGTPGASLVRVWVRNAGVSQ